MIKVNQIGTRYSARFDQDGIKYTFEITAQEYAEGPYKPGYVFIDAQAGPDYDTADGLLHDGQYADLDTNTYLVKLEGCEVSAVVKSKLIDGVLDSSIASAITACGGKSMATFGA
jgi:hypothetical protein